MTPNELTILFTIGFWGIVMLVGIVAALLTR